MNSRMAAVSPPAAAMSACVSEFEFHFFQSSPVVGHLQDACSRANSSKHVAWSKKGIFGEGGGGIAGGSAGGGTEGGGAIGGGAAEAGAGGGAAEAGAGGGAASALSAAARAERASPSSNASAPQRAQSHSRNDDAASITNRERSNAAAHAESHSQPLSGGAGAHRNAA